VDGWVTGVTIRRVRIHGAGSSGIYLETGSQGSQVVDNAITGNGFRENGPDGQTTSLGGTTVWYWGPGREGISVDGSAGNRIAGNTLSGNSAGGIFLYKNCGEYHLSRPDRWFDRRLHADGNVIEGNRISDGPNGVWVGSRMGENTLPMECSDPAYVDQPGRRIVLDFARGNVVRDNEFVDVTYGVRVEDDDTTVAGNRFRAGDGTHHAVVIGTPYRTAVLGRPVRGTVLTANEADIVGNPNPYRWVHGQADTTVAGNRALGRPVGICEGPALPRGPFVMVLAVAAPLPGGGKPPTPDLALPAVGPLPACPGPGTDPPGATTTSVPGTGPGPAAVAPGARPIGGAPTYTG
jgi:parallel beta-helix repeat protein